MQRMENNVDELLQEKPRHTQRQQENPNNFITCPRMIAGREAIILKAKCGERRTTDILNLSLI